MTPEELINRDISWLSFNARVLQEAEDSSVPLLERLRFLGIFSSNLDEFFRVRVASIKRVADLKRKSKNIDTKQAKEILKQLRDIVLRQQQTFAKIYNNQIRKELKLEGIEIIDETELTPDELVEVRDFFTETVAPRIFPLIINSIRPFPNLQDSQIYLALKLKGKKAKVNYAVVNVPSSVLSRFYILKQNQKVNRVILLDDVIRCNILNLFKSTDATSIEAHTIKLSRDAELDLEESDSLSLLEKVEKSVKQRKKGIPTRFIYDKEISSDLLKLLLTKLDIEKAQAIPGGKYHNFKDFIKFPVLGRKNLVYQPIAPNPIGRLEKADSILYQLLKRDELIAYPYQSFNYIPQLLREASINPAVKEINITLYRLAETSAVANALINAVKNGKRVRVLTELRARFMEKANIQWAGRLKEEGVEIMDSIPNLKVHSKLLQIKLELNGKDRYIGHIGTGNFNEDTAKLYCDFSLLTSSKSINEEISKVFSLFRNFKPNKYEFKHLLVSPLNTRKRLVSAIENEIKAVRNNKAARIIIKCNSLEDSELSLKLMEAADAGVKVELIIRGIFRLPLNLNHKNIRAVSIIDRYLEHARIFYFHNGGKGSIFLGSADIMRRNLDFRIEVMVPITKTEHKEMLMALLNLQLQDNQKGRLLHGKLRNNYAKSKGKKIRSQLDFYKIVGES